MEIEGADLMPSVILYPWLFYIKKEQKRKWTFKLRSYRYTATQLLSLPFVFSRTFHFEVIPAIWRGNIYVYVSGWSLNLTNPYSRFASISNFTRRTFEITGGGFYE